MTIVSNWKGEVTSLWNILRKVIWHWPDAIRWAAVWWNMLYLSLLPKNLLSITVAMWNGQETLWTRCWTSKQPIVSVLLFPRERTAEHVRLISMCPSLSRTGWIIFLLHLMYLLPKMQPYKTSWQPWGRKREVNKPSILWLWKPILGPDRLVAEVVDWVNWIWVPHWTPY